MEQFHPENLWHYTSSHMGLHAKSKNEIFFVMVCDRNNFFIRFPNFAAFVQISMLIFSVDFAKNPLIFGNFDNS